MAQSDSNEQSSVVFLVDDDEAIRLSLSRALSKRGFVVEAFDSAPAFLDSYDPAVPGCLVLDYGMPGMNGLELQSELTRRGYAIPVIFITGHGGVPESVTAMKGGALDFLEKPFRQTVLIERIQSAFAVDQKARLTRLSQSDMRSRFETLTAREREIVAFMVENPSSTSSKEIGRTFDISPRTVDHHRARILEKMCVSSVVELVNIVVTGRLLGE